MKAPPMSFAKGAVYVLNGKEVESDGIDVETGKVKLIRVHTKEEMHFTVPEMTRLRMQGALRGPGNTKTHHVPSGRATLKPLTTEQRTRAQRRIAYATACAPLYPVGPLSHRMKNTIADVSRRLGDRLPPSPHSVYRWMRRYILSNYDTAVFVQDAGAVRQREARIGSDVQALLAKEIERLLSGNKAATLSGVMDEALASVAKQLGYLRFTAKDGHEYIPDEFLILAAQRRAETKEEPQENEA